MTEPELTKRYSTKEVADLAGIGKNTLLRWLKDGLLEEPDRDRRGWRVFTEFEADVVVRFANRIVPSPRKMQEKLGL